jgi:hypothetical protein
MQRRLRDKGWIATEEIIACGINLGLALGIGPGLGYLGLEWLKKTADHQLQSSHRETYDVRRPRRAKCYRRLI